MTDLPVLPAEAQRRIEIAAEKALIQFRAKKRGCLREDDFYSYSPVLDCNRSTEASIKCAREIFQARAAEYWKVRTDHNAFKGWIASLLEVVLEEVHEQWHRLKFENRSTFKSVCLPKVKDSLRDERDKWWLKSLDEENRALTQDEDGVVTGDRAIKTTLHPARAAASGSTGAGAPNVPPAHAVVSADTRAITPDPEQNEQAARAAARQDVVMPILKKKRWTRGRLVTQAAVGKNSIYRYLDGSRVRITHENRQAIADALGVKVEDIPD
jgi:hypothetical protein